MKLPIGNAAATLIHPSGLVAEAFICVSQWIMLLKMLVQWGEAGCQAMAQPLLEGASVMQGFWCQLPKSLVLGCMLYLFPPSVFDSMMTVSHQDCCGPMPGCSCLWSSLKPLCGAEINALGRHRVKGDTFATSLELHHSAVPCFCSCPC